MKTPEEIKKGLECCLRMNCKECGYDREGIFCANVLRADAMLYIQQLEAERDAALDPIRGDCAYCVYLPGETIPDTCFDCANKGYYRWEFRDRQKE